MLQVIFFAFIISSKSLHFLKISSPQIKEDNLEQKRIEDSTVFNKPPLYWYHKFVFAHFSSLANVPQAEHYAQERKLREERDQNLDQIDKLKRQIGFISRDTEHAVLKIKNEMIKANSDKKARDIVETQRETAIKFEINHDEMWYYYTKHRLMITVG